MKPFDASHWVAAAIAANMAPCLVVLPDGRRGLHISETDCSPILPPANPRHGEETAAVLLVLEAQGRIIDTRHDLRSGGLQCTGA